MGSAKELLAFILPIGKTWDTRTVPYQIDRPYPLRCQCHGKVGRPVPQCSEIPEPSVADVPGPNRQHASLHMKEPAAPVTIDRQI